jgi:hypothetical protein
MRTQKQTITIVIPGTTDELAELTVYVKNNDIVDVKPYIFDFNQAAQDNPDHVHLVSDVAGFIAGQPMASWLHDQVYFELQRWGMTDTDDNEPDGLLLAKQQIEWELSNGTR